MKRLPIRGLPFALLFVCLLLALAAHPTARAQQGPPGPAPESESSRRASRPYSPQDITLAPLADGFTLSWHTARPTRGRILYGSTLNDIRIGARENNRHHTTHQITVNGLAPYEVYYIVITTPHGRYGVNGAPFKLMTGVDVDTAVAFEGAERLAGSEPASVPSTTNLIAEEPAPAADAPARQPAAEMPPLAADAILSDGQFVYGPNAYDFDLRAYVAANLPHLAPYIDHIEQVAVAYSINPRVLLAALELQSRADSSDLAAGDPLAQTDFVARLDSLARVMFEAYYRHIQEISPLAPDARQIAPIVTAAGTPVAVAPQTNAGSYAVLSAIWATADSATASLDAARSDFLATYRRLFPDDDPLSQANRVLIPGVVEETPPANLLQLPYPVGEAWRFNGAHTNPDSATPASIDFWPITTSLTASWRTVVAATGGTFTRWPPTSVCQAEVRHSSGWTTSYYHLEGIPSSLTNEASVDQNYRFALLADTDAEARCHGGTWPFAHVHFTLKYNGQYQYQDVNGVALSGWTVRRSGTPSFNCSGSSILYMERGTTRKNCGDWLLNHPDHDYNTISNGQTYSANISPKRDSDRFAFSGQAGQTVQIWMTRTDSGTLDSYLRLYDSKAVLLAANDDYNSLNSYISFTLTKNDTYQIIATSFHNGSTGAYQVRLVQAQPPSCNPGNDQVALFVNAEHSGQCVVRNIGLYPNPAAIGLPNDSISSVKVGSNVRVVLFEHDNYQGRASSLAGNDTNLSDNTIGNDAVSSLRVERRSSTNLALNRSVWASSQQSSSYPARLGNDGNSGTRWSSRWASTSTLEWWIVDLGSERMFDQVTVRWETAYAADHFIGWSNDGQNFTGYSYSISSPANYIYFLGQRSARYVGIRMARHAPCCGNYSFWEAEVRSVTRSAANAAFEQQPLMLPGRLHPAWPTGGLETMQIFPGE